MGQPQTLWHAGWGGCSKAEGRLWDHPAEAHASRAAASLTPVGQESGLCISVSVGGCRAPILQMGLSKAKGLAQAHTVLSAFSLDVCQGSRAWYGGPSPWHMKGVPLQASPSLIQSQNMTYHLGNTSSASTEPEPAGGGEGARHDWYLQLPALFPQTCEQAGVIFIWGH